MTVITLKDRLEARHAELQKEYADVLAQPPNLMAPSPRELAYHRDVRALYRAGYRGSLAGLYVVATFEGKAGNWLQELGRKLYYRKPHRYHVLLPLLGKLTQDRPLCPKPGWQPGRRAGSPTP